MLMTMTASCAGQAQLTNQFLDEQTGVTVTTVAAPLLLYKDNAALAAHARNFLNVGPVEVNRMGSHRYYLWVGIWSTMETADVDRVTEVFDTLTVIADGEPFILQLAGSTPSAIGASRPIYLKPVASASDAYYEVTADQIRFIAEASDIRIRPNTASFREYRPWSNQRAAYKGLKAFLASALL